MGIMLWKAHIKPGKQPLVREWTDFLHANKEEGEKTLKNEKGHLEVYFIQQENEATYLYLLMLAGDLEYANQAAQSDRNPLDAKHLEYMMTCIDPEGYVQLEPELTLGNMNVLV